MSISLDNIVIKHMFRFASTKLRKLYEPIMSEMKIRDNCMWYFHPKHNLNLHVLKTGVWDEYNEYITLCNHTTHSQEIFQRLIDTFDMNKVEPIKVTWNGSYFIVEDGCHRLALMMYKGIITDSIPLKYLSITLHKNVVDQLQKLLQSTTGYNVGHGWNNRTSNGYQSLQFHNMNLVGQRNCQQRLNEMRSVYDFTGKTVLDFGCNVGGMLHHITEAKLGIGAEYDENCVIVAKKINSLLGPISLNTTFFQFNLDSHGDIERIPGLIQTNGVDVVFVLSLGSWVSDWRKFYSAVAENVNTIFLEVNNLNEGKDQVDFFEKKGFTVKAVNSFSTDDTTGNHGRRLFFLQRVTS
jgi:hypothetical protein